MIANRLIITIAAGALVLASCASAEREDNTAEDRQADELGTIPQQPHVAACSGGRWSCFARVRSDTARRIQPFAAPAGYGPAELASAYKLDTTLAPGATIAIVDAFDYPDAESDLAQYRSRFGLPPCTSANGCFQKVNQDGQTSPLPARAPANDDWTVEAALDLDLASAACPHCKLVLVEADDDQGDGLFRAQDGAASLGVTVISNSWGGPEFGGEAEYEAFFHHPGIGIFVATGDNGFNDGGRGPDYPGTSAKVTGVGGTSLVQANNARGWTEGAWHQGGSACSNSIARPSWQGQTACAHKASSDVAAVGDPNTGLAVFNAANGGWIVVGGTSAATPFVAGVFAAYGLGAKDPSFAYQHASRFFDITTGKNGTCGNLLCTAGDGWDGPTGIGTPNGALLGGGGTCTPQCSDQACGDDGCGGSCGACSADQVCSAGQCTGGGDGACAHPVCSAGGELDPACDTCAGEVCAADAFCCDTAWDATCVREVASICQQTCDGGHARR
jgi:Subtilase family